MVRDRGFRVLRRLRQRRCCRHWSQPGFSGTPIIQLDGALAGQGVSGLQLINGATGSTIEGLDVTGFNTGDGINIDASGVQVVGNYIGFNTAGSAASNQYGVFLAVSGNTVGGTTVTSRNVISGNSIDGVTVFESSNVIEGDYIGAAPGHNVVSNSGGGISILDASGNTISENTVFGNMGQGVAVYSDGTAPASARTPRRCPCGSIAASRSRPPARLPSSARAPAA